MIKWKSLKSKGLPADFETYRTKVPGGWLVLVTEFDGCSITFYPDPNHEWAGTDAVTASKNKEKSKET